MMSRPREHRRFVPAAGRDALLPLYDPLTRLLGAGRARRWLLDAAALRGGDRVLDLGCGTGELTLAAARAQPAARLTGLDPDPKALARARAKAAGAAVQLDQGFAGALPYPDASFDHVISALVLHHLPVDAKDAALREVLRVLAPGGTLHLLDFGPPAGPLSRALTHLFHREPAVADQLDGHVPERLRAAGFADVAERGRRATAFGSLSLWTARSGAARRGGAPGDEPRAGTVSHTVPPQPAGGAPV